MWGLKKSTTKSDCKPYSAKAQLTNRRGEREDRRAFGPPSKFPLLDRIGRLIKRDRRCLPDRRISNIEVKEDYLTFDVKRFAKK